MPRQVQPHEIYIERIYDAPVAAVWDAWTDPAKVEKWWGPRGFTLTTHSKDLRPGGHWHYTMHGPDGTDYPNRTFYHEVEEYQKLVYDHGATDDQPPLFRVTALFSDVDGKTKLQMTMAVTNPELAPGIRQMIKEKGGNATWDRLAEYLGETGRGEPSFVINRSFHASIERLYQAWTNPATLVQWLPPSGFTMTGHTAEIRTGGRCNGRMSNDQGVSFGFEFQYLECSPSRIVYIQRFLDENGATSRHPALPEFPESLLHTVTFAPEDDGQTRVTLTTTPAGSPTPGELRVFLDTRPDMTIGWSGSFEKLERLTTE